MNLNDENFVVYAAKHYENPACMDTEEFEDDLARFKYIKRLFTKHKEGAVIRERLILNHLIILYNMFGESATNMLFLKLDGQWHYLKPFLIALDRLPDSLYGIGKHEKIDCKAIPCDMAIVQLLRKDLH
jgi:hypothetical protein